MPFSHSHSLLLLLFSFACVATPEPQGSAPEPPPTVEEALAFIEESEAVLAEHRVRAERAAWVQSNFITHDTEVIAAQAQEAQIAQGVARATRAVRYRDLALPADAARKRRLLELTLTLAAPAAPEKTEELTQIVARLGSTYGKGQYCDANGSCRSLDQLYDVLATSRDAADLLDVWQGWRTVSVPMKADYTRLVELANEGARELGFTDTGAMWRSKYDMEPDAFAAELDRIWAQVKPLYEALHCYVRARLHQKYGGEVVPEEGPIPAHVLGNMWAQEWNNIYDVVAPAPKDASKSTPDIDLTAILVDKKVDAERMVRYGEAFFSSLGFAPLPESFWQRSLFTKPRDREVVCHASAWDVEGPNDLRIKMCIKVNAEDFDVIHHELGHNYYQRAYGDQPFLFRDSANDGFHEAVGDVVSLSITPTYLAKIGLIDPAAAKSDGDDLEFLLRRALGRVAFLPFGLVIDKWRWMVYSGEITPERYNDAWWDLRVKYQGIASPVPRSSDAFDPGAKYHIPANVPYMRYFLARILQFQMHRALCEAAGDEGPLHRCSIYGSEAAGTKLRAMLAMGMSRPWQEALETLTGTKQMDATAVLDYFAPLKTWLDEQNAGRTCGW